MKISKLNILPLGALLLASAGACSGGDENRAETAAESLYHQTVHITREYTSRIKAAKDSAACDSLFGRYRDIIDSINFKYPADTDLQLTEGQNDTLTYLSRCLVEIHAKRMHAIKVGPDSTASVESDPKVAAGASKAAQ